MEDRRKLVVTSKGFNSSRTKHMSGRGSPHYFHYTTIFFTAKKQKHQINEECRGYQKMYKSKKLDIWENFHISKLPQEKGILEIIISA